MNNLNISPNFTIDDIHKIREYNYERRKHMTPDEVMADTAKGANEVLKHIEEIRKNTRRIQ